MPHRGGCSATMVCMNYNTQFPIQKAAAPNGTAHPKPETRLIRPSPPVPTPPSPAVILWSTPSSPIVAILPGGLLRCHLAVRAPLPPLPSCGTRAPPYNSEGRALSPPCHSEGRTPKNLRCLLTRRLVVVTCWPSEGDFRFLTAVRNDREGGAPE